MDSYQPIYDAVRSRISNADIGEAVQRALLDANLGHYAQQAAYAAIEAANEQARPCVVFKPRLYADGDCWCALFGDNLQTGVAAFGTTPQEAMWNFDVEWTRLPAGHRRKESSQFERNHP